MKRVLLVLLLVVGMVAGTALADGEAANEPEEYKEEGRLMFGMSSLGVAKTFVSVVWEGFSVAAQIVTLIALVFLIVTLSSAKTILRNENSEDYEYYHAPAYGYSGYDTTGASGSSSYAGYTKRSADFPSILSLPIVQRLTESVHRAIEAYSAVN